MTPRTGALEHEERRKLALALRHLSENFDGRNLTSMAQLVRRAATELDAITDEQRQEPDDGQGGESL